MTQEKTIHQAKVANTDIVGVNGVSFTKAAAADTRARMFADPASVVTCANDATCRVSGHTASYVGAVLLLSPVRSCQRLQSWLGRSRSAPDHP